MTRGQRLRRLRKPKALRSGALMTQCSRWLAQEPGPIAIILLPAIVGRGKCNLNCYFVNHNFMSWEFLSSFAYSLYDDIKGTFTALHDILLSQFIVNKHNCIYDWQRSFLRKHNTTAMNVRFEKCTSKCVISGRVRNTPPGQKKKKKKPSFIIYQNSSTYQSSDLLFLMIISQL